MAWEAFERKNGVTSFDALLARVRKYRRDIHALDPIIGCNVLAEPFFFEHADWIPVPKDWATNIVQGKTYDTGQPEGRALWNAVCISPMLSFARPIPMK